MSNHESLKRVFVPGFLWLTLSSEEFKQLKGSTKPEKVYAEIAKRIGYEIKDFFRQTEEGLRREHIRFNVFCHVLQTIEESGLEKPRLFVQNLSRVLDVMHPYLRRRFEEICVLMDLDEIPSEEARDMREAEYPIFWGPDELRRFCSQNFGG